MRIKIIDKYLIREFFYVLSGVFFIVAVVLLVYRVIESYEDIMIHKPGFVYIIAYFFFSLPFMIFQTIPMMIAIAIVYAVGHIARKKEILAVVSSGVNPFRIAFPLLAVGFVLSFVTFYFDEIIVPYCEERARFIYKVYIEEKGENIITRNKDIFVKGEGTRFYVMKDFDSKTNTMTKPTIIDIEQEGGFLKQRIDAEKAELVQLDGNKNAWKFTKFVRYLYDKNGRLKTAEQSEDNILVPMEENLEKFLSHRKKSEEMNYLELRNYLDILRKRGEDIHDLATDLNLKLAFPFACLIVILMGFCFAMKAQSHTLLYSFGAGIGVVIIYYAGIVLFQGLGHHAVLTPFFAAWIPNLIFALFGGFILYNEVK